MTAADQKKITTSLIAAVIIAALIFVFLRFVKPRMDAKREAKRLKETAVVQAAKADPETPATQKVQGDVSKTFTQLGLGGRPVLQ